MPIQCSTSALSGNSGRVMFKPPSTTYCLLDNTDFPIGTAVGVPASNDYRVGDRVVLTPEGAPILATPLAFDTTYYVVGGGKGHNFIEVATTETGAAVAITVEGGTAVTGVIQNATSGNLRAGAITDAGSAYVDGTYTDVALTGGTGEAARADVVIASNAVTTVTITNGGSGYVDSDTLSATAASLGGAGSGFEITLSQADSDIATENIDTPGSHINISYQQYEIVCQVTEWDLDFSRESITTTVLPCTCGDASRLANFETTIPGTASGTGSMSVLFTPDQTSTANRLIYSTLLADQTGASIKLYLNYIDDPDQDGCQADDEQSMFIEAPVVLNGFSVSANTSDALTASISFSLSGPPTHMLFDDTGA